MKGLRLKNEILNGTPGASQVAPQIVPLDPINIALIITGTIILGVGFYRTVPIRFDKVFWWQNGPILGFLFVGLYFLRTRYYSGAATIWGKAAITFGGRFLPLMILLCLVMSIGGVLTGMYRKEIEGYLMRHMTLAPLLGSFFSPTPNTPIGIIEGLWANKAFAPNFLFFLNAASLASIPLFMLRSVGFKNTQISFDMYLFGVMMALIAFPLRYGIYWIICFIHSFR